MRTCRCGCQLDMFGHHRAACAVAGVLWKRLFHLECAAAQVCREAGARVSTTFQCARWTWQPTIIWMDVVWKWSRTGSLCSTGHNWRLIRRWCRLCGATVPPGFVLQTMTERSWQRHAAGKKEPIPNCLEREGGLDWWSSLRGRPVE